MNQRETVCLVVAGCLVWAWGGGTALHAADVGGRPKADEHTVLLLHFDEQRGDPVDSSARKNDGRLENALGKEWVAGKIGGALSVHDGVYVDIEADDSLEPADFTLELWLKPAEVERTMLVLGHGDTTRAGYFLMIQKKHLYFAFSGIGGVTSTSELSADAWCHLAVTYAAAGKQMMLYVNGVKEAVATCEPYGRPSTFPFRLGYYAHATPSPGNRADAYNGLIDELRFSNVARPPAELTK
jgi:hypothetical protein